MTRIPLFPLFLAAGVAGCSGRASEAVLLDESGRPASAFASLALTPDEKEKARTARFDVNDVSFLLPASEDEATFRSELPTLEGAMPSEGYLSKVKRFFNVEDDEDFRLPNPATGASEKVDGFTDTLDIVLGNGTEFLRIVSFRFDDCAPGSSAKGSSQRLDIVRVKSVGEKPGVDVAKGVEFRCVPQLRVVAQPDHFRDVAIHFIYSYVRNPETFDVDFPRNAYEPDAALVEAIIADLAVLKAKSPQSTDGAPLGVHPGFAQAGGRSTYMGLVKSFLSRYLKTKHLTNVAFLSTNEFDGGDAWSMAGGTYSALRPDELKLGPILAVAGAPLSQHFNVDQNFEPALESLPTVRSGFIREGGRPVPGFSIDAASIEALGPLLSPEKSSVLNTDCFSCHKATRIASQVLHATEERNTAFREKLREALARGTFLGAPKRITAFAAPGQAQLDVDGANFRNFGYFEGKPSISMRTVMESAAVAAAVNLARHGSADGNGLDCGPVQRAGLLRELLAPTGTKLKTSDLARRCKAGAR